MRLNQNNHAIALQNMGEKESNDYFGALGESASSLYKQGFNVFPQPFKRKSGYSWQPLQIVRLSNKSYPHFTDIISGYVNLAVMCGRTSNNLFVLDCESPESLNYHMEQLRARKIPLYVSKTARGGHIYLFCASGEVHNIKSGVIKDIEVRGRNLYVLAPPSLHPSGAPYEWLIRQSDKPPTVSVQDIDWLMDKRGNSVPLQANARGKHGSVPHLSLISPYSSLSNTTRDYIKNGHLIPEGYRNNALFSAACDMVGNHYTYSEVSSMLCTPAQLSGLLLDEIEATIQSAFSRPREPARKINPRLKEQQNNETTWQLAMAFASKYDWSFSYGNNFRALFLALVERCRLGSNSKGIFRASIRELAELARMGINTVQRLLKKFIKLNLILSSGTDKVSSANLWMFTDDVLAKAKKLVLADKAFRLPSHWLDFTQAMKQSDASESGAMGRGAMFLYQFMKATKRAMLPSALSVASGMTLNQVNYALSKLRELGLVTRHILGWYPVCYSLDELTQHVLYQRPRIKGRGERRKQRFLNARQAFVSRVIYIARQVSDGIKNPYMVRPNLLRVDEADEDIKALFRSHQVQKELQKGAYSTFFTRADGSFARVSFLTHDDLGV